MNSAATATESQSEVEETSAPEFVTKSDFAEFAKNIAGGIAEGIRATQRPKVTIGQYMAQRRRKVKLTREVFDNNYRLMFDQLSDDEVNWLNKIHRSGRYINRKVEVIVDDHDPDHVVLYMRYSNRTADQRFENAKHWRDLAELAKKIVLEQEVAEENEKNRLASAVAGLRA